MLCKQKNSGFALNLLILETVYEESLKGIRKKKYNGSMKNIPGREA